MARPADAGSFAEAVYAQLAPLQGSEVLLDYPLLKFIGAIGQGLQDEDVLAHAPVGGDLWDNLTNLDTIPSNALSWLGQFVGVQVDTSLTVDQQKQQIRAEGGFSRGTLAAMVLAIQRFLINQRTVIIRERFTSAYTFDVVTYAGDTFVSNFDYLALFNQYANYTGVYNGFNTYSDIYVLGIGASLDVYNAILANKPAGLVFTYSVLTGQDYFEIWNDWISYYAVLLHYATYQAILDDAPVPHPFTFETVYSNPDYLTLFNDFQEYQDVYDNDLTY